MTRGRRLRRRWRFDLHRSAISHMTRKISPEKDHEYEELSAFLDMYVTHFLKIDSANPVHPTNVGRSIVASVGKSKALTGLRQAINDTLDDLKDIPPELVIQLDTALRASGIVTLTELRRRYSRQYRGILKRMKIRNETEYYLVKAVLEDVESPVTKSDKSALGEMLLVFEQESS